MTRPNPFMQEVKKNDWVQHLFDSIYEWAEQNPDSNFDSEFVDNLKEQFDDKGRLSENQRQALENIYVSWVR